MSNLKKISIDGIEVEVDGAMTIIQAAEVAGVAIPRFCYHEKLSIAANCRMCLVEIEKSPKPQASCAIPVMPGMKVFTDTPLVKKAREGVLEFLLLIKFLDAFRPLWTSSVEKLSLNYNKKAIYRYTEV